MTKQSSKILEDVTHYYNRLVYDHRELDKEVTDLQSSYGNDQTIKALKMNKLHLKQEIEDIKTNLKTLISQ
tara:strand:- start:63 stop:275 length:213 start_codon:yes stop_codon:yes gene_type:complete